MRDAAELVPDGVRAIPAELLDPPTLRAALETVRPDQLVGARLVAAMG